VSAIVPYVAPWQSGWERFATQLYAPESDGQDFLTLEVPDGQWWRIIYLAAEYTTGVTAGNRSMRIEIEDPRGNFILTEGAPAAQPASAVTKYTFAPGVTTFANMTVLSQSYQSVAIPDLLWGQGFVIHLHVFNSGGTDAFSGGVGPVFAMEVYTEERLNDSGVSIPETPALT